MTLIDEIRASAEDALSRGFAIMICEPHDKKPHGKYCKHGWQSATRDPSVALLPWINGEEANYGVSCGPSNLTVVDCDHGLVNETALKNWMDANNLPPTLIVRSGRDGEAGYHLYYSGAVQTCGFDLNGVTGELKGLGGYVVGAGSIHPSGKKYEIILDSPIASMPDGLLAFAKSNADKVKNFKPGDDKISAGNRWIHLQSMAGKLRNCGLSRDGIYAGLKDFCNEQCTDGENYPDEKIQALADAAVTKFDAVVAPTVYFSGSKKIDTKIPELPSEVIDGDWMGDLTHELSDGTFIPPSFTRAQIKTVLGASVDRLVGYPTQKDLHTRHWTMLVSSHAESGKGESWKRVGEMALANYLKKTMPEMPPSGWFSSGEHMIKRLSEDGKYEHQNIVVYFDELAMLFQKGGAQNSTLFSHMTALYDRTDGSAGSLSHEGGAFADISMSWTGGFTRSSFEQSLKGRGAGGDGFLSRTVSAYTGDVDFVGDWKEIDTAKVNALSNKMFERWQELTNMKAAHEESEASKKAADANYIPEPFRFIPVETQEAKDLRTEFESQFKEKRKKLNDENPTLGLTSRLLAHFKRDVLLRTIFSNDSKTITADSMRRSILWVQHELMLREELWPVDKGNSVEQMEQMILRAIRKHEHLTKSRIQSFCNITRAGSGGATAFNMAWKAILQSDLIYVAGKTHKGTDVYGVRDDE